MPIDSTEKHHPSHSKEQKLAEEFILKKIKEQPYGFSFLQDKNGTLLNKNTYVKPDGIDWDRRAVCEIYAHIGPLKGGQIGKIAKDILKLHIFGECMEQNGKGTWEKYLFFADEEAKKLLDKDSSSWLSYAAENLGIEARVIKLPPDMRDSLLSAQKRQKR